MYQPSLFLVVMGSSHIFKIDDRLSMTIAY